MSPELTRKKKTNLIITIVIPAVLSLFIYSAYELTTSCLAKSYTKKGLRVYQTDDFPLARRYFTAALLKDPKHTPAHINIGLVYEEEEKFLQAITAYEKVLKLTKNRKFLKAAHYHLASIFNNSSIQPPIRQPDWNERAAGHLEFLIRIEPENPLYHLQLGFASFNAVNPGRGLQELTLASNLAKDRNSLWIHQKLLEFYLQINMSSKAREEEKIMQELERRKDAAKIP